MKIEKIIPIFGWILFACIYGGLVVACLWYVFDKENGAMYWNNASLIGKIGYGFIAGGAFSVYSIVMFFVGLLFKRLWILITEKILKINDDLKEMQKKVASNVSTNILQS